MERTRFRCGLFLVAMILLASAAPASAQGLLPQVVTAKRLDGYLRKYLIVSDEQAIEIHRLNDEYRADWANRFRTEIEDFNAKWNAAYTHPDQFLGPSMEDAFREAYEEQTRLRFKLKAANDIFFDKIEFLLGDSQYRGMQRVRLAHERFSYKRSKLGVREQEIDLVQIVDEEQFSPEENEKVSAFIDGFEPVFVQVLISAAEAEQRAESQRFAMLDVLRNFGGDRGSPDRDTQVQIDSMGAEAARISFGAIRRLIETNHSGLRQLRSILTPDSYEQIRQAYDRRAYPEIFPDRADADPFFAQVLEIDDLTEDQKLLIGQLVIQYRDQHQSLSQKMASDVFDVSVLFYRFAEDYQAKAAEKQRKIARAGEQREKLDLAQPARIRAALTPEQNERLKPWIYEQKQPPRPWAQLAGLPREPREHPNAPKPPAATQPASQ